MGGHLEQSLVETRQIRADGLAECQPVAACVRRSDVPKALARGCFGIVAREHLGIVAEPAGRDHHSAAADLFAVDVDSADVAVSVRQQLAHTRIEGNRCAGEACRLVERLDDLDAVVGCTMPTRHRVDSCDIEILGAKLDTERDEPLNRVSAAVA